MYNLDSLLPFWKSEKGTLMEQCQCQWKNEATYWNQIWSISDSNLTTYWSYWKIKQFWFGRWSDREDFTVFIKYTVLTKLKTTFRQVASPLYVVYFCSGKFAFKVLFTIAPITTINSYCTDDVLHMSFFPLVTL